jgi:hypothetical protein
MNSTPQQVPSAQANYSAVPNSALLQAAGPQASANLGNVNTQNQVNYAVGSGQLQQGYLQGEAGFQQQGLNLQGADLQTQIAALQRQFGLLPQYNTLQQQLFGLQGGSLQEQEQKARIAEAEQKKGLMGSAAASGSVTTEGTRQGLGDIEQQLQFALQDIDRSRQQLDISKQQYGLGYNEKVANLQDQQKYLDTQSKRLGISQEELQFRLQKSLDQLGLSTQLNVSDLLAAGADLNNGLYSPAQSLLSSVFAGAGIPGYGQ